MGSVVGYDLVDPGAVLAHPSVHGWCVHIAVGGAPGDNANEHPRVPFQADKGASRVTLRAEEGRGQHGGMSQDCVEDWVLALTWHEEAPEPPAQIMESVMREPQYCWH